MFKLCLFFTLSLFLFIFFTRFYYLFRVLTTKFSRQRPSRQQQHHQQWKRHMMCSFPLHLSRFIVVHLLAFSFSTLMRCCRCFVVRKLSEKLLSQFITISFLELEYFWSNEEVQKIVNAWFKNQFLVEVNFQLFMNNLIRSKKPKLFFIWKATSIHFIST
jgi:hypothetical protein